MSELNDLEQIGFSGTIAIIFGGIVGAPWAGTIVPICMVVWLMYKDYAKSKRM